jgi:hypothetical protein
MAFPKVTINRWRPKITGYSIIARDITFLKNIEKKKQMATKT